MAEYDSLRRSMVAEQLVGRGIHDKRVLSAFKKVQRHLFVRDEDMEHSYEDHPIPIGDSQTISQPYMVALMTECLMLKGSEKVLEVGTGSGYQAAILAEVAKIVYSVERFRSLADGAGYRLSKLGYKNISIKVGDGTEGWPETAPYDGIVVTAGAPALPDALVKQLSPEGRIVIPIGSGSTQILSVFTNSTKGIIRRDVCSCVFVPLVGKYGWQDNARFN